MKRLFGFKKKRQLTPRGTPPGPMYNFAMQEYHQTVAPETSNDDGRASSPGLDGIEYNNDETSSASRPAQIYSQSEDEETAGRERYMPAEAPPLRDNRGTTMGQPRKFPSQQQVRAASPVREPTQQQYQQQQQQQYQQQQQPRSSSPLRPRPQPATSHTHYSQADLKHRPLLLEPEMPDTTYEENYGAAYVGGTIKYIYPSGYQSMRPRGGPWKLSIVICVLFTWLSVFIVGHCSDRADAVNEQYYQDIDDDAFVIETRWCGSRVLYFMWVMSMSITGLAMAYCSVIGYIKVRDFAVANSRSQPPGIAGKSDYYVRIDDAHGDGAGSVVSSQASSRTHYHKNIYQSDGTPAFWGGHIYRPTQAAVAVTSR